MTVEFLLTVQTGPSNADDDGSHPSFRRICGLIDGHGIPATWLLDRQLMADTVAEIPGAKGPDAGSMVSIIESMITAQDIEFAEIDEMLRVQYSYPPAIRHILHHRKLRHVAIGYGQVIKFRRGLRRAVQAGSNFHLIFEPGLLTSTSRCSGFLENILFHVSEYRADGRIEFTTLQKTRLIRADFPLKEQEAVA